MVKMGSSQGSASRGARETSTSKPKEDLARGLYNAFKSGTPLKPVSQPNKVDTTKVTVRQANPTPKPRPSIPAPVVKGTKPPSGQKFTAEEIARQRALGERSKYGPSGKVPNIQVNSQTSSSEEPWRTTPNPNVKPMTEAEAQQHIRTSTSLSQAGRLGGQHAGGHSDVGEFIPSLEGGGEGLLPRMK